MLDIIGVGFGRTGTLSLKSALEQLGFGPCHHGDEVIAHRETAVDWIQAADGRPVDWDAIYDGYRSTVDWPGARFWRELTAHFPEAKVILTFRDPEQWYESMCNTVFRAISNVPAQVPPEVLPLITMIRRVTMDGVFGGEVPDRETALRIFAEHIEAVRAQIPGDRLLIFDVAEGWGPLCAFLDVPVPATPFPRANDQDFFTTTHQTRLATAALAAAAGDEASKS
ncbi:sulfotransferase family protein [Pseudofrankia inefficax]|uniref:Sulfotransferase family protein n=1 Tax=Pseudofrankia inefficax (strain DSM 45817 / CECT 9037 / DDB 130130 / EuI1c) TaxID=298654 RepID=E3JA10_PSEI1|nr:sulfotransferase family protein [Pseudofrankia inefficax]ADP78572.1 hypothetical protein FraEuI1c_0489 [Pseudofrankia inefficax]